MGNIFGISDLPVTIFTTPLQQPSIPKISEHFIDWNKVGEQGAAHTEGDVFVRESAACIARRVIGNVKK